jgi:tetratricopeptide (TPR) repeat protein
LIEALGFEGNRQKGLQLVTGAAQLKTPLAVEAMFNLIWVHGFVMEDFAQSHFYSDELIKMYQASGHIKYIKAYILRREGKLDEAHKYLTEAQTDCAEVVPIMSYCLYDIAYNHYLNQEWHLALEKLQKFHEQKQIASNFRTFAAFIVAMCYEMLFQSDKAAPYFKRVQELVRKSYDYDEYADRRAKKFLAKGFSLFDRKYFMAAVHAEASRPDDALDTLEAALAVAETVEEKAAVAYLRGSSLQKKKSFEDAKKSYEEALAVEKQIKSDLYSFIVPHSLVGLGELALNNGLLDEAEKHLKRAKSFSGYDFSQLTQWRIIRALDSLSTKRAAAKTSPAPVKKASSK